jgi:hypothetical protein
MGDAIQLLDVSHNGNPLDDIESFINEQDWPHNRLSEHEILVNVDGNHCHYAIDIHWNESAELLTIRFLFSFGLSFYDISSLREVSLHRLISKINRMLYVGHFDLVREQHGAMWKHSMLVTVAGLDYKEIGNLFSIGLSCCERYYPTFNYVLWAGKSPEEAIGYIALETVGEA